MFTVCSGRANYAERVGAGASRLSGRRPGVSMTAEILEWPQRRPRQQERPASSPETPPAGCPQRRGAQQAAGRRHPSRPREESCTQHPGRAAAQRRPRATRPPRASNIPHQDSLLSANTTALLRAPPHLYTKGADIRASMDIQSHTPLYLPGR
ncbi:unnamed protein product [Staurois parvus]|uniref:Uncharacterized protein n=1 Tax=Staurois parvus TaxID=386267 RepID=A0ABN9AS60_9NEOB|nr:unnamed protein product [Staurois parvus]